MLTVLMHMITRSPVTPFKYLKRLQMQIILRDLIHDSPHLRAAPRTYERVAIGLSDCRVVSRLVTLHSSHPALRQSSINARFEGLLRRLTRHPASQRSSTRVSAAVSASLPRVIGDYSYKIVGADVKISITLHDRLPIYPSLPP
jgi:hypothetical protein